jgi:hypothetical protein
MPPIHAFELELGSLVIPTFTICSLLHDMQPAS